MIVKRSQMRLRFRGEVGWVAGARLENWVAFVTMVCFHILYALHSIA